jgi:hypothetical protein
MGEEPEIGTEEVCPAVASWIESTRSVEMKGLAPNPRDNSEIPDALEILIAIGWIGAAVLERMSALAEENRWS